LGRGYGATQAFYERLGFTVTGGDAGFRILTDGEGWQIALRPSEPGWVIPDRNSHGIYLYCEDVDAVADRVALCWMNECVIVMD
jgi:hypothetical protein